MKNNKHRSIGAVFFGKLCVVIRLLILVISLSISVSILTLSNLFFGRKSKSTFVLKKMWCRFALLVLGIKVNKKGDADQSPGYLCVSNHINFLDPIIIMAYLNVRPVGKHEIEKYPLIGFTGKQIGMLFVNRVDTKSRKSVKNDIESALEEGSNILVFPEATTGDGSVLLDFKIGSFTAAQAAEKDVVYCSLCYHDIDIYLWRSRSLVSHFFYQASFWSTEVDISILGRTKITSLESDVYKIREEISQNLIQKHVTI